MKRLAAFSAAFFLVIPGQPTINAQTPSRVSDVVVTWDSVKQITSDTLEDMVPEIFTSGDTVHLFWGGGTSIYGGAEYARSADEGSSFDAPREIGLSSGSGGGWVTPQGFSFGVAGGSPYLTATSILVDSDLVAHNSLAVARSANGGTYWDTLSSVIGCSGFCVAEGHGFTGHGDRLFQLINNVYPSDSSPSRVAYSTNAGVDWEPPVAIPSGNQPARIGANAWGLHYAGVFDTDSSTELYYQRTSDLGMNWEGTILTSAYDVFYDSPGLAITDAGDVYAVWRSVPEDSVNPDSEEFVRFRHSSDNGATWENVRTLNASKGVEFPIVAAAGSRVAVTWNNYPDTSFVPGQVLMVSTDFGATWSDILPVGYHGDFGLAFTNRYIHVVWSGYIGSPGWEIYYRRGVIGNVTSVGEEAVPSAFSLSQNYPNPFNGATTISYVLARRERVSLRVHNVYGELMGMLVDGTEPEGRHDVRWEPGTLASGVYFYRLQAGMHSESRKLLFMK